MEIFAKIGEYKFEDVLILARPITHIKVLCQNFSNMKPDMYYNFWHFSFINFRVKKKNDLL